MILFGILIIIILKLIWCWYFLWNHPDHKITTWDAIKSRCKTGDLILFHGLDNYNPIFIGSYYSHIGIVYRESPQSRPYIFEAWNPTTEKFYPKEISHGIAFADLENRIKSYRGYIVYKQLMHPVAQQINIGFYGFIYWALCNMKYNKGVIINGINKLLLNDKLRSSTNCGELVYLSLIKLGLLDGKRFYENRKHHLKWICDVEHLDSGNEYLTPVYVWQTYFKLISN